MTVPQRPELVVRAAAEVGEGPLWWGEELRWVELTAGLLHVSDPVAGHDRTISYGGVLGAVVPVADGGWAAITGDGFGWLTGSGFELIAGATTDADHRMNDGKCDRAGRFWAGSAGYGFPAGAGALHRWSGGTAQVVDDGLTLPNGIGWSPDDSTMYLIDSMPRVVYAYDFDLASGEIDARRVVASFTASDGLPDGLAVDAEGCIWVAFHGGGCLRRITPDGRVVHTVAMPVSQPTSCAFGSGTDLYVTSAREGFTAAQLHEQPLAGSVFRVDAEIAGSPVFAMASRSGQ